MEDFDNDQEEETGDGLTIQDVMLILRGNVRSIVACGVIGTVVMGVVSLMTTPEYTSRAVIQVVPTSANYLDVGEAVNPVTNIWQQQSHINTQLQIMRSRALREKIAEEYNRRGFTDPAEISAGMVGGRIKFVPRQNTELLDVSVTTANPQLSSRLANVATSVMQTEAHAADVDATKDAKVWLAGRIDEYEERIVEDTEALIAFRRKHGVANVGDGAGLLGVQLDTMKDAYATARTERVQLETLVRSYEQLYRQGKYLDLAEDIGGPVMDPLVTEFANVRTEYLGTAAIYGEKMPQYQEAQRRVDSTRERLRREVKRVLDGEKARLEVKVELETDLREAITGGKEEQLDVMTVQGDYEKLKINLDNAKLKLTNMLARREELELQAKTKPTNIRVIEEARPAGSASTPNTAFNLMLGLFGGFGLGIGLVVLREFLDDTVASPMDVKAYLHAPLIGMIPQIKEAHSEADRTLYTHENPRSNVAEAVRGLRTLIDLNPNGRSPRSLLFTSALSSEGKTSTAARLAIGFANLNRSVILLDLDLRRPRIHKVFEHHREPGITSVIRGTATLEQAIRPTGVENLSYMSAGASVVHPNEVLAGKDLQNLLSTLQERFDMVIVDSPPSAILSDARILSRYVDGVVMLVKQRLTSRVVVREAIKGLQQVGAPLLGVVLNEVVIDQRSKYTYYTYGYGYRYDSTYYTDDDPQETAAK